MPSFYSCGPSSFAHVSDNSHCIVFSAQGSAGYTFYFPLWRAPACVRIALCRSRQFAPSPSLRQSCRKRPDCAAPGAPLHTRPALLVRLFHDIAHLLALLLGQVQPGERAAFAFTLVMHHFHRRRIRRRGSGVRSERRGSRTRASVEAINKAVNLRIIISLKVFLHQERCTLTGSFVVGDNNRLINFK